MTRIVDSKDIVNYLNSLIELDYEVIAAYKKAIVKLEDQNYKNKLKTFLQDHENHKAVLIQLVCQEGGKPANSGSMKQTLSNGKEVIAEMSGDEFILHAILINEEVTIKTDETEIIRGYREPIQTILIEHLVDKRRHMEWLEVELFE